MKFLPSRHYLSSKCYTALRKGVSSCIGVSRLYWTMDCYQFVRSLAIVLGGYALICMPIK